MGEAKRRRQEALSEGDGHQLQVVDTLGGRMHVRWDEGAAAKPHGQLVFFAEFLATTGVFERWVSSCPLEYKSGNAPDKRDVLGTLMLGLLAGHRRYAHITALRGDAVAARALGMNKVVSEDALRRALERMDEPSSTAWMRPALMHSVREVRDKPWVLDIDASIKPLYGRQQGAEIGYNPIKPGRPSHVLHTELKNQWGMSGFTTQDINRCQTTARACGLVYNWWSWYCRAANPTARMEAITSRPLLLAAVGRAAYSGGQTTLYLTPLHGKTNILKKLISSIGAALHHVKTAAEQFKAADPWALMLRYVSNKIAPSLSPFIMPTPGLPAPG